MSKYYLCFNGDRDKKFACKHIREIGNGEVMIRDVAICNFDETIQVELMELVDEDGELWAMRRLPSSAAISPPIALEIVWVLRIVDKTKRGS